MPLYMNGGIAEKAFYGASPVDEAWIWDGTDWTRVFSGASFGNGTLTKVGDQTLASTSSFNTVTGWAVEGAIAVEDGGVRVPEGVSVTVVAALQFLGGGTYNTSQQARLMNGNTELVRDGRSFTSSGPINLTSSFVGTGELLTLQAVCNQTSSNRNIVAADRTTLSVTLD